MSVDKFGIKVPFDSGYLWVTHEGYEPVLFNSKEQAVIASKIWGPLAKVEKYTIEEYL